MAHERKVVRLVGATGKIKTASFRGREHLVVPVVALIEGVVWPSNCKLPELALASEFGRHPNAWNGRPVVLDHPKINGESVSANDPEILDLFSFGHVFNARLEKKSLLMDAWLDVERAGEVGPEAVKICDKLREGKSAEVSVGTFTHTENKAGTHEGKPYLGVWRDPYPDHLAMLPEGVRGACNNEMGCGARTASANLVTASGFEPVYATETTMAKTFKEKFLSFLEGFEFAEEKGGDENGQPKDCGCKGDEAMTKAERIAALKTKGKIKEEDVKVLEGVSEDVLKALEAEEPVKAKEEPKPEPKVPAAQTLEELLKSASPDLQEALSEGIRVAADRKSTLVKTLLDTKRCPFTEEMLKAMKASELENLITLAGIEKPEPDFSGRLVPKDSKKSETVPAPPSLIRSIRVASGKEKAEAAS
jgi:hypothetical protein